MNNLQKLLREFVFLVAESKYSSETEYDYGKEDKDEKIKRGASTEEWRSNRDESFEGEIDALVDEPEFSDVETFVSTKLDDDDYSFNAVELQALARNVDSERLGYLVTVPSVATVKSLRLELTDEYGFAFVPRTPVKHVRGSMSAAHGKHPFAGSGGGGSGFGNLGALGGGYEWNAADKKNLGMGAGRNRR